MIVLKRPIITEKSMELAQKNLYTFEVDKNATKDLIAKVVAKSFAVKVLKVKVTNVKGKTKMQRSMRKTYQVSGMKKAFVQVGKGGKIAIFETPKIDEVVVTSAEGEPQIMKEKKNIFGRTKVRVETGPARPAGGAVGAAPTTQRKVIPT